MNISGFIKRTDVYLVDYSVSENGSEITLQVGVESSMGYVRDFLNDTNEIDVARFKKILDRDRKQKK